MQTTPALPNSGRRRLLDTLWTNECYLVFERSLPDWSCVPPDIIEVVVSETI